ncbi:MAG: ATP synthase F0 subunit C [Proteobacteria bacterium]|nr:ATP synthase F0 subunit C [Pseudomonadota bacterium]
MKRLLSILFTLAVILAAASPALAETAAAGGGGGLSGWALPFLFIAAGFGMAIGTLGPGLGQGRAVSSAVEAMARNPAVSGKILTAMLIGLAMIEALAIYALVVALVLMFVFGTKLI